MRYRIIVPALRHTIEYQRLSSSAPNARMLLEWLMTGDVSTIIPGLLVAGRRMLMEQLGWDEYPEDQQCAVWQEVLDSGLVRFDPKTRLVWLPFMVEETYLPDQPNILKSWVSTWGELPDCVLKHEAWVAFRNAFADRTPRRRDARGPDDDRKTAFAPLFVQCCPEPKCGRSEGNTHMASEPACEGNNKSPKTSQRGSVLPSQAGSQRESLQDQHPHQDQDQGPGGPPEAARARDPSATALPPPVPPAQLALPAASEPAPRTRSRFDCSEYKPLVTAAALTLITGSGGRIIAPMVDGSLRLDAKTIGKLLSVLIDFNPSDAELTEMGRLWLTDEFWKATDQSGRQRLCSIQYLATDHQMFGELLSLAQRNLGSAPALEIKSMGRGRGKHHTVVASAGSFQALADMTSGCDT